MAELVLLEHSGTNVVEVYSEEAARLLGEAASYVERSKAPSSLKSYGSDWKHFVGWCEDNELLPLPARVETVAAFLVHCKELGLKSSTIGRRLASIAHFHGQASLPSPCSSPAVKRTLAGIKREIGTAAKQSTAIDASVLKQLVDTCGNRETLLQKRDSALILVSWTTACRVSEVVSMKLSDVVWVPGGAEITIQKSKVDQEQKGRVVLLPAQANKSLCAVTALRDWLEAAGPSESGWLFRGCSPAGTSVLDGALNRRSALRALKGRLAQAGLNEEETSFHGLRAGWISEAAQQGMSAIEISEQSGHSPNSSVLGTYIRVANKWNGINAATKMVL